jgi:hypothetical protein
MNSIKKMERWILIPMLLLVLGVAENVYGQKTTRRVAPQMIRNHPDLLIPVRDTVIMRGEGIEVGAYFHKNWLTGVEIVGFGKSKKSDLNKGFYIIKQNPKQTITYQLVIQDPLSNNRIGYQRTIYVAKTAEEKKQLEKKLEEKLESERKSVKSNHLIFKMPK